MKELSFHDYQKPPIMTCQGAAVSRNPATETVIAEYHFLDAAELEGALNDGYTGFQHWRKYTPSERAQVFTNMATVLRSDTHLLSELICAEIGKPITQARAEIEKSANVLDWYAEHGPAMLSNRMTSIGPNSYIAYRPLGPVLAVMPWNFPVWQVLRGAVGRLMGGNGYALKPAPNVVGCALALRSAWDRAGLPNGAFTVLNIDHRDVAQVIHDPRTAAVTLTGSVAAGSAVAEQAGRAIKKVVLELGGSDPFIILADADLEKATQAAVLARFTNSGQVCIAAKRMIVESVVVEEFTERLVNAVRQFTVGNPLDPNTFIGPIARSDLREQIDRQVKASLKQGARLLQGGGSVDGTGYFYEPTVLGGAKPGTIAFDQEIFGPVAAIVAAVDVDDAVVKANDSQFGLSASIWSADVKRAHAMASSLDTGGVFINGHSISDPRIPIGGTKKSGFGRDLSSFGLHEFVNVQSVWDRQGQL